MMRLFVTGGAGFIGSAVIRQALAGRVGTVGPVAPVAPVSMLVNLDKMTYAANPLALEGAAHDPRYHFEKLDILDRPALDRVFAAYQPTAVMHLAAESHVDRSIDAPAAFLQTNVVGTFTLLEASLDYWKALPAERKERFRFHHVSTDEVFGSLGATGAFSETTPYAPNSPYSASKAASDHFVRAWHHTFGLPTIISNCSNNYGPWQFPEKLIPLMIIKALLGQPLPVYGSGANIRDWLHVEDHARALLSVLQQGRVGENYTIGGNAERTNLEVVESICDVVDRLAPPLPSGAPRRSLVRFVTDRPGHDARYAIDARKVAGELGWRPRESFASGLAATVSWYLAHQDWWQRIGEGGYQGQRLGQGQGLEQGILAGTGA